jgi:hypothetical protein
MPWNPTAGVRWSAAGMDAASGGMSTPLRTPTSDAAIRVDAGARPRPPEIHLLFRFCLGTAAGAVIGAMFAWLHSGPAGGSLFLVEFEFLATGFAMVGGLFALIGATPAMQGWGEDTAHG